jgi:hypothetical protein
MRMAQEGAESIALIAPSQQATSSAARCVERVRRTRIPTGGGLSQRVCAVLNTCRIGNDVQLRSIAFLGPGPFVSKRRSPHLRFEFKPGVSSARPTPSTTRPR